ncbi:MAG TPA: Tic22 family protein [Nostocaceae cyanobacterium]|nr:Tic22 family protein [Nostocaceae cyanobacterium]
MKSLVRWGLKLGVVGSIMLAGLSGMGNLRAMALPEAEVVKTLQDVPVFTLTNPKGEFVVLSTTNQNKTFSQIGFFVSQQDAKTFLENRLKKENPQLASTIQIRPISLADYYKLVMENRKKKDSSLIFTVVPSPAQVNSAKTLLSASGQQNPQIGVPLFVPKFKQDNSYLTISLNQTNERFIPFYFEKEQATALLEEFKKARPQEAANTTIEVVDLYGVLETLTTSNDPGAKKIYLYPSRESIKFIQSVRANQPAGNPASGQRR